MKKLDFSNGHIVENILRTALPLLVAQVISLLYNIVDRIYIGRIPEVGTEALGAVGMCFPVTILILAFTNMYGMGGAPLFSMEIGRGNEVKAGSILNTAFRLQVGSAVLLFILGEIFCPTILRIFGAQETQMTYAIPYLRIYLIGTICSMVSTGMNPYLNGQGYATMGMMTVLIGAVANIILDPVFIFLFGMGVSGAAIATVISQTLSAAFVLSFLFGKKNEYPICREWKIPTGAEFQKTSAGEQRSSSDMGIPANGKSCAVLPWAADIIGLGTAPFVMQITNSLVSIACNQVLIVEGGAMFVSVMTIVSSVRQILDTPMGAIAEGASPMISYSYGAEKPDQVKKSIIVMSVMAIGYTLIMWFFIEKCPGLLIGIFTDDPELQEMALRPLHLYFLAFVFQSFQYSGQTAFKALNKKKHAIFFSLFRKAIMVIPLTYLLPWVFGMGTDGVFIAEPVSNLIGGAACFTTMILTVGPELRTMSRVRTETGSPDQHLE